MPGSVFQFGLDISQIKAGLAELSALQNQIFANQPPPALANVLPPNLGSSFTGLDPNAALQNIARITGAYEAALRRLRAEGSITAQQQSQLLGSAQNIAGGPIPSPLNAPKTQEFFASAQGGGFSEEQARAIRAEYLSASGSLNRFKGDEAAFAQRAGEVAKKNLGLDEQNTALLNQEILSQEQIASAIQEKNAAIRKQIVKLQSELGIPINQGAEGASTAELASLQQQLVNTRRIRNAAEQAAAREAAKAAELESVRGQYLIGRGTTAQPSSQLTTDASSQASLAAEDRQIAVAFGRAKQEAYLEQLRYNETFARDLAEESALRQARLGIEKQNVNAALDQTRAGGTTLRQDVVAGEVSQKAGDAEQAARVQETLAADEDYIKNKVASSEAHAKEAAAVATGEAGSQEYISAKIAAAQAHLAERDAIAAATTEDQIATRARVVANEKIVQAKLKAAEAEALTSAEAIEVEAKRIVAERARTQALNQAVARELTAQGASRIEVASVLGATGGRGGANDLSGFLTGGLLTTVKYALPAAALFGAISGIKESVQEAQKLQKIFAQLEAQAQSLGQADSLQHLKDSILNIAASTGTASSEVADLAFQFQGAFGGETEKTIQETRAAVEAVKVTGLGLKETIDAFTAISQSFKGTGVSIEEVTDTALGLQERFGVLAKETISFAADLAPVGAQIGLTAEKIETLGAVSQKYSGRSGSNLAEAFGRALPQLQKNAVEIISLFDQVGKGDVAQDLAGSFASGQTGNAFESLLKNYKDLSQAQKNFIIEQIGGRREAAAIIPVLEHADEYFDSLVKGQNDAGKTSQYYAKVIETLSNQLGILGEKLKQLAINLFQGGLGQALGAIVGAATGFIDIFGRILEVVLKVNSAMGNIPVTILASIAVLKLLGIAYTTVSEAISRFVLARRTSTAATEADTAAEATNTSVRSGGAVRGFASNVAANYRAGLASTTAGSVTTAPGTIAAETTAANGLGVIAVNTGGVATLNSEVSLAAQNTSLFGRTIGRAATGIGAFANALPPGLVVAGAVIAISQLITTINDIRSKSAEAVSDLENKIKGQSTDKQLQDIERLRSISYSPIERVSAAVSGTKTAQQIADETEARLQSRGRLAQADVLGQLTSSKLGFDFESLLSSGGTGSQAGFVKGSITGALAGARQKVEQNPSDPQAQKELQDLISDVINKQVNVGGRQVKLGDVRTSQGISVAELLNKRYDQGIQVADQENKKQEENKQKAQDLKAKFDNLSTDLGSIKNQIASGDISIGEGLSRINTNIAEYERILREDPAGLAQIDNAEAKYREAQKARVELISNAVLSEAESANRFIDISGGGTVEQKAQNLTNALRTGSLNRTDSKKATDDLIAAYKDLYDYRLNSATSLEGQIKIIKEGIPIDDAARIQLVRGQLDQANAQFQQYIATQSPEVQKVIGDSTDLIAKLVVERGEAVKQATIDALRARAVEFAARADALKKIRDSRTLTDLFTGRNENIDQEIRDAEASRDAATSGADTLQNSNADLGQVNAPNSFNPKDAAEQAKEEARRTKEYNNAKRAYIKALHEGDSILAAQLDLQSAREELSGLAQGSKEWYEAAAKVEQANNALKNANEARRRARFEYYKALNIDDPIAQAQIDVQLAQEELRSATADDYDSKRAALLESQHELDQAVSQRNQAVFNYYKQVFSDDPVTVATISITAARDLLSRARPGTQAYYDALSQVDSAQKQERDAREAIDKAHGEFAAAYFSGNEIKSAEVAKDRARYDIAHAKNEAERLQALASQISADKQYEQALQALYDSQSSLLNAQANYVGDTVAVAKRGLQDSLRKLAEVQRKYSIKQASDTDLNNAKADVVRATGDQRDAIIKKSQDDYDFQYQMGQITKSQYIQYLEGLKSLADGNQQIIRDLDLKIKGLKNELGADLQFNLPANINLPTLYEVRRLNQSRAEPNGPGIGYQDNRKVDITIQVNNGTDLKQIQTLLSDVIGNPRYGNGTRRY